MKIVETGVATLLFVKTVKGLVKTKVVNDRLFLLINDDPVSWHEERVNLPPGNWSDAVCVEDVTEEIAKNIIPDRGGKIFDHDQNHYHVYEDYKFSDHPFHSNFFDKAFESFQSLLKANEIYTVNPYGRDKPFNCGRYAYANIEYDQWQAAEENTGNWMMLIKQK